MIVALVPFFMSRSETFYYRHIRSLGEEAFVCFAQRRNEPEFPFAKARQFKLGWPGSRIERGLLARTSRGWLPRPERLTWVEVVRLAGFLRTHRPQGLYSMFLWNAVDLALACDIAGVSIPQCVHVAGSDISKFSTSNNSYQRRARHVLQHAALVTAGSKYLLDRTLDVAGPLPRAQVHYLGTELPTPDAALPQAQFQGIRCVAVGRLVPVKGPLEMLTAFAAARKNARVEAVLTVVGDGPLYRECRAFIDAQGLGDVVQLLGSVSHEETLRIIRNADIFIPFNQTLPGGAAEALGGSIIEAQAAGVPAVVTASGGVPEAVPPNHPATTAEDVDTFAEAIRWLMSDPQARRSIGANGQVFIRHTHNATTQDRRFRELLLSAIERSR